MILRTREEEEAMFTRWQDVLERIRRIELSIDRDVDNPFAGGYRALTQGQGMDFEEVREYAAGDEVRFIDWNVTARSGRAHVKRFREEREQTMLLLVDLSASGEFGSERSSKRETAALIASTLAFSALENGDRVGLILFTDRVEKALPPRKGKRHVLGLIREILTFSPVGRETDVATAIDHAMRTQKRRATLFLLSDLANDPSALAAALPKAAARHEVVALEMRDAREEALPNVGTVVLEDAESGETVRLDTGSKRVRQRFAEVADIAHTRTEKLLAKCGIPHAVIPTAGDPIPALARFFELKRRRRRR